MLRSFFSILSLVSMLLFYSGCEGGTNGVEVGATQNTQKTQNTRDTQSTRDTQKPIITLKGDSLVKLSLGDIFTDPGATAQDSNAVDISSQIKVSGSVNSSKVGRYFIFYNVQDSHNNKALQVKRVVVVSLPPDTTKPTITLIGNKALNIYLGTNYIDAGATALDNRDGDITSKIVKSGSVNKSAVGRYYILYDVQDSAGNKAQQVRRTVVVSLTPDTTKPTITLIGNKTLNIYLGTSYTDAGATASDNRDGVITSKITKRGSVDTSTAGTYYIYYNVKDSANNSATQVRRKVIVSLAADTTKPVITLQGSATVNLSVGDNYSDAGATASDNRDGVITSKITKRGSVDTSTAGTYYIYYNVKDSANNQAIEVKRKIIVSENTPDITKPVITLNGLEEVYITVGDVYIEYGATALDDRDGVLPVTISKTIDTSKSDITTIKYTAVDSAGNVGEKLRLVVIEDAKRGSVNLPMTPILTQTQKDDFIETINNIRTHQQTCGDGTVMPAVGAVVWNEQMYKTAYAHSNDRDINSLTGYPGWTGSGTPRDPVGYNKNKKSTYTERIPSSGYAASTMKEVTGVYTTTLLDALNLYMSDANTAISCQDIMNPDVTQAGVSVVNGFYTIDFAAPLRSGVASSITTYTLYDKSALDKYGSEAGVKSRINHIFSVANAAYKASTLDIHVTPIGYEYYSKTNSKNLNDSLTEVSFDDEFVHINSSNQKPNNKRNKNKAHTVMLFKAKNESSGVCGLAHQPQSQSAFEAGEERYLASREFAAVYMNCYDRAAVHELGHNFGLKHSHKQDGATGLTPYNYGVGYGVENNFVTIMAYKISFGAGTKEILRFSSPLYECDVAVPCGIPVGETNEADAVKVLVHTVPAVSKLYP